MKFYLSIIALLLLSNQALAIDYINATDFPEWFQKSLKTETKIKKKSQLKIDALKVNSKVLGKAKLAESGDGYLYYTIEFGSDSPAECYVLSSFDGRANSLYSILDGATQDIAEAHEKALTGKFNFAQNAGIIGSIPYLSLDLLYHLGEGQEKLTGLLKGYSAQLGDTLQVCVHNEVGNRASFFSIFESFLKALNTQPFEKPFFEIVYQTSVNGIPAGIALESYKKDKDGDVEINYETAVLMPVDAFSMASSDTAAKSWSTPEGDLINANSYSVENAILSFSYSLNYENETWIAEGESQGKEQRFELSHKGPLPSQYGSYFISSDFLKSDAKETNLTMWMPEIDPSSAVTTKLRKISNNKEVNVEFDLGVINMKTQLDKHGVASLVKMQQGPVEIQLHAVHQEGKP